MSHRRYVRLTSPLSSQPRADRRYRSRFYQLGHHCLFPPVPAPPPTLSTAGRLALSRSDLWTYSPRGARYLHRACIASGDRRVFELLYTLEKDETRRLLVPMFARVRGGGGDGGGAVSPYRAASLIARDFPRCTVARPFPRSDLANPQTRDRRAERETRGPEDSTTVLTRSPNFARQLARFFSIFLAQPDGLYRVRDSFTQSVRAFERIRKMQRKNSVKFQNHSCKKHFSEEIHSSGT